MEIALISRPTYRSGPNTPSRPEGFSLLEMMMVTLILIVALIATPSTGAARCERGKPCSAITSVKLSAVSHQLSASTLRAEG
jgi:Tfp pilus assembly protein FimT